MKKVILVQHLNTLPNGREDVKIIGVYRSLDTALAAIDRVKEKPGFSDYPEIVNPKSNNDFQGFHIDEYVVDQDHWEVGFETP